MIQTVLKRIWSFILKLNMAIRQWFGLHLHEREMESLTKAEIRALYLGYHRAQIIKAAVMGIAGGIAVGIVIGVMWVSIMRAF